VPAIDSVSTSEALELAIEAPLSAFRLSFFDEKRPPRIAIPCTRVVRNQKPWVEQVDVYNEDVRY